MCIGKIWEENKNSRFRGYVFIWCARNVYYWFDHNSNRGNIEIYNSGSYSNGRNINFSSSNIANSLTIKNTLSLLGNSNDSYNATTTDIINNGWQNGIVTNANDFVSLNIDLKISADDSSALTFAIKQMSLLLRLSLLNIPFLEFIYN